MTDNEGSERVALVIDPDDEFGGDYDEPSELTPSQISGTVVYTLDWTAKTIIDQIDADPNDPTSTGVLVTSPPFQRRSAWTTERQSLFIESLMLGLPIPPLVLAESKKQAGTFYVLDGKQRLTALKAFAVEGGESLKLKGLEVLGTELEGKSYRQIAESEHLRSYLASMFAQPVRTIVVRNWQSPALLHLIFARLNRASVPLASHELRQALYPGPYTNYVNERSAESEALLQARRLDGPDFRLRDAETLLRSLSLRTNLANYRGDLSDFLDRSLKGGNAAFEEIGQDIEAEVAELEAAIRATFDIFGTTAFLRFDPDREKYMPRFNVSVFDLMTWYLADASIREAAQNRTEDVRSAYEDLSTRDSQFVAYLTATTKTRDAVVGRIGKWGNALGKVVGKTLEAESYIRPIYPLAAKG